MKRFLALSIAVLPLMLQAQSEPVGSSSFVDSVMLRQPMTPATTAGAYDTLVRGRFVYSGIVVQMFSAPQPLQLINPLAPKEYGNGEQNLSLDPITKRPMGLKLFAVSF